MVSSKYHKRAYEVLWCFVGVFESFLLLTFCAGKHDVASLSRAGRHGSYFGRERGVNPGAGQQHHQQGHAHPHAG